MSSRKSQNNSQGMVYKKSNIIIGAKYKSTIYENKLFAAALYKLQNSALDDKNDDITVSMTGAELKKIFNKGNSIYSHLKPTAKALVGRSIGIEDDEKKEFHYMSIVTDADYAKGVFTITFNKKIKSKVYQLQNKFTLLSLPVMMDFKSVYSFRLYELLESETFIGNRNCQQTMDGGFEFVIGLSELKLELGVIDASEKKIRAILDGKEKPDYDKAVELASEKRYDDWRDLKKYVLEVATKEITEKTEMNLIYKPYRAGKGGKIVAITFTIHYKDVEKKITDIEDVEKKITDDEKMEVIFSIKMLLGNEFSIADARNLAEASSYDLKKVTDAIDLMNESETEINNVVGWIIDAIKKNYQPPKSRKKASSFMNYMQTGEELDSLEDILLDN